MGFVSTIDVFPQPGGMFRATSFQQLIGTLVQVPGLDPQYDHTLNAVDVADGGSSARLTVTTTVPYTVDLAGEISLLMKYKATVEAVDLEGNALASGQFDAPLQVGQTVKVHGDRYLVHDVSWPNRHPEYGVVADGELDVQRVVLAALEEPPPVQST